MSPDSVSVASTRSDPLYAALEERVLARDQKGASEIYYGLVKSGRPLPEMLREAVRIHGLSSHVLYHERIDAGYVHSVTNGHCSLSARATVELGDAIGWDLAHDVLYAGALDIAVGPRWYSLYEAASNAVMVYIEGQTLHAVPYSGTTEQERALLTNNKAPLDSAETEALIEAIIREPEPAYLEHVTRLLKAGKSPRAVLAAIQVGAAQVAIETHDELN